MFSACNQTYFNDCDGLKSYFLTDSVSSCPKITKQFFNNPTNEAYVVCSWSTSELSRNNFENRNKLDVHYKSITVLKETLEARIENSIYGRTNACSFSGFVHVTGECLYIAQ